MLIKYDSETQMSETTLLCNTGESGLFSNVSANISQDLPMISLHRPALLCAGGPSIADTLEIIKELKAKGGCIFALNNCAKFLFERGIKPDYQIILDPRPENIEFVERAWAKELLLCSQAHPSLAEKAKEIGYPTRLWHPAIPGMKKFVGNEMVVSVSLTVGLSAISLAHVMGHHDFHLFGYDSCHSEKRSHAYDQIRNASDEIVRCCADSKIFYSSMTMAGQANQFKEFYDLMTQKFDCTMKLYGDGLLQTMWKSWTRDKLIRPLIAVYDLGVSPPTYDFLSFLIEAERHRRANGYTVIDVLFQPGPMNGFRDDDLPPDLAARQGMLWRVCVGMARLLPSVRNISVNKGRWETQKDDIFPLNYKQDSPKAHYATMYLKGGEPMLRASKSAVRAIAAKKYGNYATITLRGAGYWGDRNSNLSAWIKAASWLRENGIYPVFVPDTHGEPVHGFANCVEAALDIDYRAALYEGAVINLGVLNGPMSLCAYLRCRYLIFKIVVESAPASSSEFLKQHGFNRGDDFGGNGRFVWENDDEDVILRELQEFSIHQQEKTS